MTLPFLRRIVSANAGQTQARRQGDHSAGTKEKLFHDDLQTGKREVGLTA